MKNYKKFKSLKKLSLCLIRKFIPIIPDNIYLKLYWKETMDYTLNLNNPQSFNEKITWIKLYNRNPLYTKLADKWLVKDYVALHCGSKYVVKNYGVWNDFDSIDFNKLPKQFVLKCTHASNGMIICKNIDNFDKKYAKKILTNCLKNNFYKYCREWCYKDIKPRIIAEEYLGDNLQDYRVYCFNGIPKMIYSYTNKSNINGTKPNTEYCDIFDTEWHPLPFRQKSPPLGNIQCPKHLNEMLDCAKKLSNNIPFVRVDFYDIDRVIFSECTFYPGGGFSHFYPQEWDFKIGSWLQL